MLRRSTAIQLIGLIVRPICRPCRRIVPRGLLKERTGAGNRFWAGTLTWDVAHHGSAGYLAYLITGDYYYLQDMENQSALCYLMNTSTNVRAIRVYLEARRALCVVQRTVGQLGGIGPPTIRS